MQYKLPISIIIISLFASLASSAPKGAKRLSDLDQDNNGQINFEEYLVCLAGLWLIKTSYFLNFFRGVLSLFDECFSIYFISACKG